ncbi:peptidoglycan-binding domain-containing protein [Leptospira ilyithenensis]|uniref:Peptidoglycan-binding protein n=1 Tax=Leptospira ilyithenensis TaxID=2484901 RepID=A0A4R9LMP5_9LEPT|nr:peptidoglycan-binding domain-containing protein [Leptospira ilyithenensis]TGN09758.1 peptidoglycan-binding protein [Leptospira ilyithenensis]
MAIDRPLLRRGSKGTWVGTLQTYLNDIGNYKLVVDNDFGVKTETAVISEQRKGNLVQDGVVGPATWGWIDSQISLWQQAQNLVNAVTNSNPLTVIPPPPPAVVSPPIPNPPLVDPSIPITIVPEAKKPESGSGIIVIGLGAVLVLLAFAKNTKRK